MDNGMMPDSVADAVCGEPIPKAPRGLLPMLQARIDAGAAGLIIVGEVSVLGRSPYPVLKFFKNLVDAGGRLIAFHDGIDTERPDWEMLLHIAMIEHQNFDDTSCDPSSGV